MRPVPAVVTMAAVLAAAVAPAAAAGEAEPLLKTLKSVGREGSGNPAAAEAWRKLVRLGPDAIPEVLAAMDDAEDIAANWLRPAVDALAERALSGGGRLPADKLEAFVLDTRHGGASRRLAYEWLVRADPTAPKRLIPGMLEDPGAEMRRDAVALVIAEGEALLKKGDKPAAAAVLAKALHHARDTKQVLDVAAKLKTVGIHVDPVGQFGLLTKWLIVGPFDNTDKAGYAKTYAPEEKVDLTAALTGKADKPVKWFEHVTGEPLGTVDLNKAVGKNMGAVAYCYAVVESPEERPAQIRVGSWNAVKVYLNGKPVFAHEEYHHGSDVDQYVAKVTLQKGRNEILLKVCQNEQTEFWAQNWSFTCRVCDALGAAVPLKNLTEMPKAKPARGGKGQS